MYLYLEVVSLTRNYNVMGTIKTGLYEWHVDVEV